MLTFLAARFVRDSNMHVPGFYFGLGLIGDVLIVALLVHAVRAAC